MLYVKIKEPDRAAKKERFIQAVVRFVLELIIAKGNPDYESKIDLVVYWLLEFKDELSTPEREIGLTSDSDVIVKMPYNKNQGYWVDNNLTIDDFRKSFEVVETTKEYFDDKWNAPFSVCVPRIKDRE